MAFPDDLTVEQLLEWSPTTEEPPSGEDERRARAERQFRLYFLADSHKKLVELAKEPASTERERKARRLRVRTEAMRELMLQPRYDFLVEDNARHIEYLLDEIRELID